LLDGSKAIFPPPDFSIGFLLTHVLPDTKIYSYWVLITLLLAVFAPKLTSVGAGPKDSVKFYWLDTLQKAIHVPALQKP
jgi:hypothetical protein